MRGRLRGAGLIGLMMCGQATALDWEWAGASFTLNNRASVGAAIRMQDIDYDLVGKLNVPGQERLCQPDDCLSLNLDPAPNQRLVNARGAFSGVNADNGNLNYDKHDLVAATTKLVSDLSVNYGDWLVRIRGMAYYDPANVDFDETHNYTLYQPRRTKRARDIEERYASGVELYDAFVQYSFDIDDTRQGTFSVGNQIVRWGESTLVQLNSLAEINPPNANRLRMPGSEINEVFQAVPLALLSVDVVEGVSAELLYQLAWVGVEPDATGSFFSDTDLIGGGRYAQVSLGQFGEDPDRRYHAAPVLGYLTSTTTTIYPEEVDPRDGGQYGARLNYYADWLNGGTELGFYFLNYHSRLPNANIIAADESCARDAGNLAEAYLSCNGFNGDPGLPKINPLADRGEPLPVDTVRAQLIYPEDIQMFGLSFNTNIGDWSLAGEYSYRPNLPLQIHIPDIIFAGLQPAFPANQIDGDLTGGALPALLDGLAALGVDLNQLGGLGGFPGLGDLLTATFPAARVGVPSYVVDYRGYGRVEANQVIPGYERLKVGQLDLTAIKAIRENPLGADQILVILEAGMTQVYNMPDRSRLQFEGNYVNNTSYAPGADGTGQPDGQPDPRTLVPTQQRKGFADDFAWGVRALIRSEYNNLLFDWSFKPQLIVAWDIEGIAPFPMQNFVEGRVEIVAGTDINFTQALTGRVLYQWFTGAGDLNTRRDRDNLALSLSYSF
ncbi:MAG TPA: DUF1302 family protein [Solimonas sp.]